MSASQTQVDHYEALAAEALTACVEAAIARSNQTCQRVTAKLAMGCMTAGISPQAELLTGELAVA